MTMRPFFDDAPLAILCSGFLLLLLYFQLCLPNAFGTYFSYSFMVLAAALLLLPIARKLARRLHVPVIPVRPMGASMAVVAVGVAFASATLRLRTGSLGLEYALPAALAIVLHHRICGMRRP